MSACATAGRSLRPRSRTQSLWSSFQGGKWTTIALWDNADAFDEHHEHHEHEYTQTKGKQPPTVLPLASVNEATAAAIRKATTQWRAILTTWSER